MKPLAVKDSTLTRYSSWEFKTKWVEKWFQASDYIIITEVTGKDKENESN